MNPHRVHLWIHHWEPREFTGSESPHRGGRATESRGFREQGRSWYRGVLAGFLGRRAEELTIQRTPAGKPFISRNGADATLEFSVSYAFPWAVLAISPGRAVGVDIEAEVIEEPELLAAYALSADERSRWEQVTPEERGRSLAELWTRKEALAKAVGTGLTRSLPEIRAEPAEGGYHSTIAPGLWQVRSFRIDAAVTGSLAVAGAPFELHRHD